MGYTYLIQLNKNHRNSKFTVKSFIIVFFFFFDILLI